jgi:hypothetical protein
MKKLCSDCKIKKNSKEFNKRKASPDGRRNQCRLCEKKYKSTFTVYMKNKYNGIIKRSKAENLPLPDMTKDEFILEVNAQLQWNAFRCPITGDRLEHQSGNIDKVDGKQNKNSYSIDRLDPTKGYMKDNILVVSWRWNRMKSDTPLNYMMRFCFYMKANFPKLYMHLKNENMKHFMDLTKSAEEFKKEFKKIINKGEDEDDITYN